MAILTITAYRRVSPRWLRALLVVSGLLLLSRYIALASFTPEESWVRWWRFVRGVGLTLPGIFAVDQLVRHPAITPKTLLRWYSPWAIAYGVALLTPWWQGSTSVLIGLFTLALLWICCLIIRKLPDRRVRIALAGLCLACLLMSFSDWLFAEMLVLLAIWNAFETSASP
ncbi:MAG: hypothetical protein A3I71_00445 [Omnitrophica WOR_2 bacterium RIFCSPLOWO2_02_FULL_63_16]|nr:MAG: hypothetical protein A3B73_04580 [Omnitrophica WOR_2 bacterium RIFCSPHIGHO2_02_FULL_63_39]OGX45653.1 MAG: hypothetical protein A3I71_00445 [Omnitrophica WOR_2 bacterium RIFCSPLOWO2_02_FULL_63_16]HAM40971.1 hypothetical protein [Candidatus Omnitrophota bacterium]